MPAYLTLTFDSNVILAIIVQNQKHLCQKELFVLRGITFNIRTYHRQSLELLPAKITEE